MNELDTSYLSAQDQQTLGEDLRYVEEIRSRKPTIFFRPNDRTAPSHPNFLPNDCFMGFIEKYGSHLRKIRPLFSSRIPIHVLSRTAKKVAAVTPEEYAAAYTELSDANSVIRWLEQKYPEQVLTHESVVTVYKIEYV